MATTFVFISITIAQYNSQHLNTLSDNRHKLGKRSWT